MAYSIACLPEDVDTDQLVLLRPGRGKMLHHMILVGRKFPDAARGVVVDDAFVDQALAHPGSVVAPGFFEGFFAPYQIAGQKMALQFVVDEAEYTLSTGFAAIFDEAFDDEFAEN